MRTEIADFQQLWDSSEINVKKQDAIVKKVYTREDGKFNENDDLVIIINTIDTEYLRPGTYYYEIKLRQENLESNMYQVDTIISKRKS